VTAKVKGRRPYNTSLRQEQAQMTRERILAAARRVLLAGRYGRVTMEEIAREAAVAPQTIYAAFGTKLRLAQAMVDAGFPHVQEAFALVDRARESADPVDWLRTFATMQRRIFESCGDLIRFMHESGDPNLFARYEQIQRDRRELFRELGAALARSHRLRPSLSEDEAATIAWVLLGPDSFTQFVFDQGWTPDRFEDWAYEALAELLLIMN
jgi:AcrR family transcriptional regulator